MTESPEPQTAATTDAEAGCVFPTGPHGETCGRAVVRPATGRPSSYCDNPKHTRGLAFSARQRYAQQAAGEPVDETAPAADDRPVTDARSAFGAVVAHLAEQLAAAQRAADERNAALVAQMDRALTLLRTVTDPEAAAYEVDQIQRQTGVQVNEAETARAAAIRAAEKMRRELTDEREKRAQADEAAETALAEGQAAKEAAARQVDEYGQMVTTAKEAQLAAEDETERIRTSAAAEVATVKADAEQLIDTERAALAEQLTAARAELAQQLEQAQSAADERVAAAEQQAAEQVDEITARTAEQLEQARAAVDAATTAQTRADTQRADAVAAAERERATAEGLRTELDQARREHNAELTALRKEAREERDQLRRQFDAQLAELLARFDQARQETAEPAPAEPKKPARRSTRRTASTTE